MGIATSSLGSSLRCMVQVGLGAHDPVPSIEHMRMYGFDHIYVLRVSVVMLTRCLCELIRSLTALPGLDSEPRLHRQLSGGVTQWMATRVKFVLTYCQR